MRSAARWDPGTLFHPARQFFVTIWTMHDGRGYRSVFSKGMIASLLDPAHCDRPLGTTWPTYRPNATIVGGDALIPDDLHDIVERVWRNMHSIAERFGLNTEGMRIRAENRMTEDADWD